MSLETLERPSNALQSIEATYQHYWSDLVGFIRSRFGSPPDPEDIAQSAFIKYADAHQKKGIENAKAFLYKTARNLVIDHHRSPKNLLASQEQVEAYQDSEKSDVEAPENVFTSRQELFLLEKAIMALPERDRAFLLMNRLEDMTYTEIAKQAGMSRSGVQKIITQSLEKCMKAVYQELAAQ